MLQTVRSDVAARLRAPGYVILFLMILVPVIDVTMNAWPPRLSVVGWRFGYFGGLSEEEIAAVLSMSRATITREWRSARAWLYRRMSQGRGTPR